MKTITKTKEDNTMNSLEVNKIESFRKRLGFYSWSDLSQSQSGANLLKSGGISHSNIANLDARNIRNSWYRSNILSVIKGFRLNGWKLVESDSGICLEKVA